MSDNRVTIMGSYVADVAFRIDRLPTWGETRMGQSFQLGPGGKGSNQAVAAARAGAPGSLNVSFISKLGSDPFGEIARTLYRDEGIDTQFIFSSPNPTGAAAILIDATKGENAIIVVPGACFELTPAEVDQATALIASSSIFVTQLELPLLTVEHGLRLAHTHGIPTILNPAPAAVLPDIIYPLCDYLTPNETEAAALTGIPVTDLSSAEEAASSLLALGVRNVILTLGSQGALIKTRTLTRHIPAVDAGPVVETTGAGDAFNGGFATALAEGMNLIEATQFACAVAGISVTRPGTAPPCPAATRSTQSESHEPYVLGIKRGASAPRQDRVQIQGLQPRAFLFARRNHHFFRPSSPATYSLGQKSHQGSPVATSRENQGN